MWAAAKGDALEAAHELRAWTGLSELTSVLKSCLRRHCRDDSEADDIVQETLIRAACYRDGLLNEACLRGWVIRIAINLLRDHVRCEKRLPRAETTEDFFEQIEGRELVPGELDEDAQLSLEGRVLEKEQAWSKLVSSVRQLQREDQAVLGSFYGASCDIDEAARACAIHPGLVKARLFRARQRLLRIVRIKLSPEQAGAEDAAEGISLERLRGHDSSVVGTSGAGPIAVQHLFVWDPWDSPALELCAAEDLRSSTGENFEEDLQPNARESVVLAQPDSRWREIVRQLEFPDQVGPYLGPDPRSELQPVPRPDLWPEPRLDLRPGPRPSLRPDPGER